ncbi:STAS domain-containing protein [Streptomyces sp. NPDC085946]|uniref:STAS domain-containing protein n=1 Tax=Streptomyces sp. NPDC085946 TaxID=3365744 RepID=UPI0037CE0210
MLQLIDRSEDLVVAALPHDVDFFTSADVRAAGERLLSDGCRYLVLDSSPVTYMDSSGITALLAFRQRLEDAGGALIMAVPDEHLRRRLGILGLDTVLVITVTLDEAITHARRLRDTTRSFLSAHHSTAETKSA